MSLFAYVYYHFMYSLQSILAYYYALLNHNQVRESGKRSLRLLLLLVQLLQLLHPAKSNPVNNGVIHPHHECWRNDELAVFIIDPVHCRSINKATK